MTRAASVIVMLALAPVSASAQADHGKNVGVQMRNVDFHVDSTIVLHVTYLRGELRPTSAEHAPYFDDDTSFSIAIDTATIAVTPKDLGDLLNRYTFSYPGSPLRRLTLSIEKGQLKQRGLMRGVSFTILADLTLTPDGELRLHPTSIKAVGIKVGGLMKFLGLHLDKLVKLRPTRGVRIKGDDFLLKPTELLPPPVTQGQVAAVEVGDSDVVLAFKPEKGEVRPLVVPVHDAANYMYYRGGVLRFGKLTMHDADLFIQDAAPEDPFDFYLKRYARQLVAGTSRTTADLGLIVVMPDYRKLPPAKDRKDGQDGKVGNVSAATPGSIRPTRPPVASAAGGAPEGARTRST